MRERKIPKLLIEIIIKESDSRFYDTVTSHSIFLKRVLFRDKKRLIAVSADITENQIIIISVHPIKEKDYILRIGNERWHKL